MVADSVGCVTVAEMSLKALKEEMVAFMVETPPADTSVRSFGLRQLLSG